MTHRIRETLLLSRVNVALVGAGGTGSQMLTGLARLDAALRALDHPGGLHVTVYDPDVVTRANVGRQLFSPADIGCPKATVLVHRINCWYGLDWDAVTAKYGAEERFRQDRSGGVYQNSTSSIVISCVDSAEARRSVFAQIDKPNNTVKYWLDCGNRRSDGQVMLGEVWPATKKTAKKDPARLRHVFDFYPELARKSYKEDTAPSCSLAESLEKQDLFINDHVSRWGLHLLWTLFRRGEIEHHGYLINLVDGAVNPLRVPE